MQDKQQVHSRLIQFQTSIRSPRQPNGAVNGRRGPLRMKGLMFCVFAVMMLPPAQGKDEEQLETLMESVGPEGEEEFLQCFRCDLGFWDVCYTTETTCSLGELCYTGRGSAATLDIKTLGCVKAEDCGVESSLELFSNKTIFVVTKHCCHTPFCNAANNPPVVTRLYLTVAVLVTWHLTKA